MPSGELNDRRRRKTSKLLRQSSYRTQFSEPGLFTLVIVLVPRSVRIVRKKFGGQNVTELLREIAQLLPPGGYYQAIYDHRQKLYSTKERDKGSYEGNSKFNENCSARGGSGFVRDRVRAG